MEPLHYTLKVLIINATLIVSNYYFNPSPIFKENIIKRPGVAGAVL